MHGLPLFHELNIWSGFSEGWATYAEQLAADLGWYEGDSCALLGLLESQLYAAAMTVVETGAFALGWTEEDAYGYVQPLLGWSREDFATVLSIAYFSPCRMTTYLAGRMEFLEQRRRAMDTLGDRFDYGAFHECLLRHGAAPLASLDSMVDAYIERVLDSS
jgi:uncharacterized protein (DUF885 family)